VAKLKGYMEQEVPAEWTTNIIVVPIYRNKGDKLVSEL
jgi:hypothetical protein